MGKGSGRRPASVSDETMASNWERIFGKTRDALASDSDSVERHFEEAAGISDEMRLHQQKMRRGNA